MRKYVSLEAALVFPELIEEAVENLKTNPLANRYSRLGHEFREVCYMNAMLVEWCQLKYF